MTMKKPQYLIHGVFLKETKGNYKLSLFLLEKYNFKTSFELILSQSKWSIKNSLPKTI